MRIAATIALLAALAGCDGPPALPQPNGPMLTWNTAMWGVAAPPVSREVVPPGTPNLKAVNDAAGATAAVVLPLPPVAGGV